MQHISEPFALGESLIHDSHPGFRVICAFLFSLVGALVMSLSAAVVIFICGILFAVYARLPMLSLVKRLLFVNGFIFFLWLFLPFSRPGELLFTVGPFTATAEGVLYAAIITLKSNGIVLAATALISTMPVQLMGAGMQSLKLPDKLCRLFLFTWRYVHVMGGEYEKMKRAAVMRGFTPSNSIMTYRTYAWLLGMLLVRSWDRAQVVWQAMLCRGFTGKFYTLNTFKVRLSDWLLLGMTIFFACVAVFFQFYKVEVFW